MTAQECGKPGHLYPVTDADHKALTGGPASEEFWKASMVGCCADHAPEGHPAPYASAQIVPCQTEAPSE